jgi:hypothetical protein
MACVWVLLASRTTDEPLCGTPGHPQCLEHQREMDTVKQADKNWAEILAPLEGACDGPRKDTIAKGGH